MNIRRLLLPSLSTWVWLLFCLGLSLSNWRLVLINGDGDACLHWRIGHWMIEHRTVIRTDVFSHTRAGAPLISKEWLGEVLFAAMGDALGWNGIVLLAAALIATTLWLLHRQLLAEGNEPLLSTALTLVAALSCSAHWLARPHLFTQLLAVLLAWQVRWFDLGRLRAQPLLLRLAPLTVLWVNLHGAFFTGFVIIGTFFLGNIVTLLICERTAQPVVRRKLITLAVLAAAFALAALCNPNGWKLPAHVMEFLRDPVLAHYANEFRSPNFHSPGTRGFMVELALVAVMLITLRPKLGASDIVIMGTWGFLALLAARNAPIFALMVTPIIAAQWQTALQKGGKNRLLDRYRRFSANLTQFNRTAGGCATVMLVLIALLAVMAKPRVLGGDVIVASNVLSSRFPVAATAFVNSHASAVSGELFNDYGWGGYLILKMPAHKVFIDGRNDFYGADLIRQFDDVNRVHQNWNAVLQEHNVGWTILPRAHALNSLLALRGDWRRVYSDNVAVIYARDSREP